MDEIEYSPAQYAAWAQFNRAATDIASFAASSGQPVVAGGGMVAMNLGRVVVVFGGFETEASPA